MYLNVQTPRVSSTSKRDKKNSVKNPVVHSNELSKAWEVKQAGMIKICIKSLNERAAKKDFTSKQMINLQI